MKRYWIIVAIAFLGFGAMIRSAQIKKSTAREKAETATLEQATGPKLGSTNSQPQLQRAADSSAQVRSTASVPSAPVAYPQGSNPVLGVLSKYSGTSDWTVDNDETGRAFKFSGGKLKDIMSEGVNGKAFLTDLQAAMGFQKPAVFTRETQDTARVTILELKEGIKAPNGQRLDVFGSSLRLLGDTNGDAFLVYNELRPVSDSLKWDLSLSDAEAIAIARAHLQDPGYKMEIRQPAIEIYAHQEPHQKVTKLLARNGPSVRMLLIGHDTRTVVWDKLVSLN